MCFLIGKPYFNKIHVEKLELLNKDDRHELRAPRSLRTTIKEIRSMPYLATNQTFIQNKYLKWYVQICERGQRRAKSRKEAKELLGYVECHHILPRCLGGLKIPINETYLTAREHFIVHWLLPKFTKGNKDVEIRVYYSLSAFRFDRDKNRKYTAKQYEVAKKARSLANSIRCRGVPLTESHKAALRGKRGKYSPRTDEHIKRLTETRRKRGPISEETRQRMRESALKRWHS